MRLILSFEVKPETEATFRQAAQARGMSVGALLDTLAEELEADAAQDKADAEEMQRRLDPPDPRPRRTLADLRAHIEGQREAA